MTPLLKLAAAALAATGLTAVFAGGAFAYPADHNTPSIALGRSTPPTTAECVSVTGLACYDPAQIETAYNMHALYAQHDEGQGQTIVIVDCFGSPTIQSDLKAFDAAFNLPAPRALQIIQPAGAVKPWEPGNPEMTGWAFETTLDVEYAHTMAPAAKILLVETPEEETEGVQGFPQIVEAENYVVNHKLGQVITQSFGADERSFPGEASLMDLRSAYENAAAHNVTVLAASGDTGVAGESTSDEFFPKRTVGWPASDPLVTAVGGTQLHLNEEGQRTAPDNAWDETLGSEIVSSGGGKSKFFSQPEYQKVVPTHSGLHRAVPDISMSAAVNGGVLVYTSYPGGPPPGFSIVGGTSEASPLFSGVVAIADQIAGHPLGQINPTLYRLAHERGSDGIVEITSGNNTFGLFEGEEQVFTVKGYEAKGGYSLVDGLGTVDAFPFAHALAGR